MKLSYWEKIIIVEFVIFDYYKKQNISIFFGSEYTRTTFIVRVVRRFSPPRNELLLLTASYADTCGIAATPCGPRLVEDTLYTTCCSGGCAPTHFDPHCAHRRNYTCSSQEAVVGDDSCLLVQTLLLWVLRGWFVATNTTFREVFHNYNTHSRIRMLTTGCSLHWEKMASNLLSSKVEECLTYLAIPTLIT